MRQTQFSGGHGGGLDWGTFYRGLSQGNIGVYLLLIGLVAGAIVALWAGTSMMKGEKRR